jgi:hypothetical protein
MVFSVIFYAYDVLNKTIKSKLNYHKSKTISADILNFITVVAGATTRMTWKV